MSINRSDKKEKPRFTGMEKIRMRKILKENPMYFDKIIRDVYGPPPPKNKSKGSGTGPTIRDKDGKVIRALLNKGGLAKKRKKK